MPKLTITLSEERYQALKAAAARRHVSLGALIDDSLEFYGIKSAQTVASLVSAARQRAALGEDEALALAIEESRAERQGR
jgi:hypothetical protein